MKGKRFLATVLCAAMVFTTDISTVNAAEITDVVTLDDGMSISDASDSAAEDILLDEATDSEEEDLFNEEVKDAIDIMESVSSDEVSEANNDGLSEDIIVEVSSEEDELTNVGAIENKYFTVDPTGALCLKSGVSLDDAEVVTIPCGAERIPSGIFTNNSTITSINFEANSKLTVVEESAFQNSAITSFYAPPSLMTISANAFNGCEALSSVDFENIKTIGNYAFQGCKKLTTENEITGGQKIDSIGDAAFKGTGFTKFKFASIGKNSENLALGNGVFSGCTKLTEVVFSDNISVIPKEAFKDCETLASVDFNRVSKIDNKAFANCGVIKSVTFGEKLNYVGEKAFDGCDKLTEVVFLFVDGTGYASDMYIASDAFSNIRNITLKGYDGEVLAYAGKCNAKGFVSLVEKKSISIHKDLSTYMKVTATGASKVNDALVALPGSTVTLTFEPNTETNTDKTMLIRDSLKNVATNRASVDFEYVSYNNDQFKFKFIMPKSDVIINGECVSIDKYLTKITDYSIGKYRDDNRYQSNGSDFVVDTTGRKGQILLSGKDNKQVGQWMFTYEVTGSSVKVDENGVITSIAVGESTVTVKSRYTKASVSFRVNVTSAKEIKNIELIANGNGYISDCESKTYSDGPSRLIGNVIDTTYSEEVQIIKYDINSVRLKEQKLNITVDALNVENEDVFVDSKWKTSDSTVAKLESKESYDNCNTITIPKGSSGSATITVSVTTGEKDDMNANKVLKKHLIIRIIDSTPVLKQSTVTVNIKSEVGSAVELIPTAGTSIYDVMPNLYSLSKSKYQIYSGIQVTDGKYDASIGAYKCNLVADSNDLGELAKVTAADILTKSGSSKLYIKGKLKDSDSYFYIPINKLKIVNQNVTPTFTTSGKINLFYNSSCYDSTDEKVNKLVGKVKLAHSISTKTERVVGCGLMSTANYKYFVKRSTDTPEKDSDGKYSTDIEKCFDSFRNNFDIEYNEDDNNFIITRSDKKLAKSGSDVTTSGYIVIWYEGYKEKEPVYTKISIPTKNSGPSLVLSKTSATVNIKNLNNEIALSFLDKSTKKVAVSANDIECGGSLELDNNKSTLALFKKGVPLDDNGNFSIKVNGAPSEGKAVIKLKENTWNEPVSYTFKLKTTSSKPTAKLGNAKVTVNKALDLDTEYTTKLTLNQPDCCVKSVRWEYAGKDVSPAITIEPKEYNGNTATISVKLNNSSVIKKNYKFKLYATTEYSGEIKDELKPVTLTVAVVDKKPSIKFSTTTYTFNTNYPEAEVYNTKVTFGNVTNSKDDLEVDITSANLIYTGKSSNSSYADEVGDALEFSAPRYDEDLKKWVMNFQLGKCVAPAATYSFKVTGIKINNAQVADFTIKVKCISAAASVSVKVKSSINPVDDESYAEYTATFKNLKNVVIDNVEALAYDNTKGEYLESKQFEFCEHNEDDKANVYRLKMKSGIDKEDALKADTKYPLIFEYNLVNGYEVRTGKVNASFSQKLPKLSSDVSKCKFYASQGVQYRFCEVALTKTSVCRSRVNGVKLSDKNDKIIKNAFEVEYLFGDKRDDYEDGDKTNAAGKFRIYCVNPELLKQNGETYTVYVETVCENQLENSTGRTIELTVTVKK